MRRGSPSTRHGRTSSHVDRVVLRTFVAAAGLACVAMGVVATATGEPTGLMTRSVLSAVIAGYALWRLQTGRNAVPVLFVSMAVIVVAMALRQSLEAIGSGTLGVVGLALAAALLSSSRGTVLAASAAAVVSVTLIRWRLLDESALDLIASGFVAMIVIVFGSQLMEWAKQEITGRDRRFDTLFDHPQGRRSDHVSPDASGRRVRRNPPRVVARSAAESARRSSPDARPCDLLGNSHLPFTHA